MQLYETSHQLLLPPQKKITPLTLTLKSQAYLISPTNSLTFPKTDKKCNIVKRNLESFTD